MPNPKAFRITGGCGFHIEFSNGYIVSVQFCPGTYSDHHDRSIGDEDRICGEVGAMEVECAVLRRGQRKLVKPPMFEHDVKGWMSPEEVLELMNWTASLPNPKEKEESNHANV